MAILEKLINRTIKATAEKLEEENRVLKRA